MKDYSMWLKSGQQISGTCSDDVAEWLRRRPEKIMKFKDSGGDIIVLRCAILAIGTKEHEEDAIVRGFECER